MVLSSVGVHLPVALASRKGFWDASFVQRRTRRVDARLDYNSQTCWQPFLKAVLRNLSSSSQSAGCARRLHVLLLLCTLWLVVKTTHVFYIHLFHILSFYIFYFTRYDRLVNTIIWHACCALNQQRAPKHKYDMMAVPTAWVIFHLSIFFFIYFTIWTPVYWTCYMKIHIYLPTQNGKWWLI